MIRKFKSRPRDQRLSEIMIQLCWHEKYTCDKEKLLDCCVKDTYRVFQHVDAIKLAPSSSGAIDVPSNTQKKKDRAPLNVSKANRTCKTTLLYRANLDRRSTTHALRHVNCPKRLMFFNSIHPPSLTVHLVLDQPELLACC